MNNKTQSILVPLALVTALVTSFFWHREHEALTALREQAVASELQPIASLLTENQTLVQELQSATYTEGDSGILQSYLLKIRRDGVAKHAAMRQLLDQLAENNTSIVALIKAYTPRARTAAFMTEADKFRNYASAWRDRWNSVMELFMLGGNYAASNVPMPEGLAPAVQSEIAAAN